MDQKEEHEHLPDNITYHPVDEQCRKKNQEPQPRANKQCRKKSHEQFLRGDVFYHQGYHKAENTSAYPPCAKRHHAANSHHNSESEDDTEEVDYTTLTKADIPTIVDTVLSNISMEGTSSKDDSQDISHLDEYRLAN